MRKQIIGMLAGITLLAMGTAVGSAADTVVSQPVQSAQPSASPTQTASPDSKKRSSCCCDREWCDRDWSKGI